MKTKLKILSIFVVLLTYSCKNYLEVKSDDKLVVPKTLSDIQGLLDDATIMNIRTTPSLSESSADDFFWPPATYVSQPDYNQRIYTWQYVDYRYGNDWNQGYLPIYNANLALELLESIPRTAGNSQDYDNAKGSALFFRAYYFLLLSMQYSQAFDESTADTDLGIVLRLDSDFNKASKRASVRECYQRILADLNESASLLPTQSLQQTRPSRAASYGLLARTYLYMRKYDQAAKAADESLKLNAELMDYNSDPSVAGLTANVPFRKFNRETLFYTEMGTSVSLHLTTRARIDSNLYASYDLNDLRRTGFFRLVNGYQQYKGSYAAHATTLFSGLATDEIYLTRAESYAQIGELNKALTDLNTLLKKRWRSTVTYLPFSTTDKTIALAKIRLERRKELLMRNLRWMDIKRLNKEGAEIVPTRSVSGGLVRLPVGSKYYALPIPVDVIEQSGIEQN